MAALLPVSFFFLDFLAGMTGEDSRRGCRKRTVSLGSRGARGGGKRPRREVSADDSSYTPSPSGSSEETESDSLERAAVEVGAEVDAATSAGVRDEEWSTGEVPPVMGVVVQGESSRAQELREKLPPRSSSKVRLNLLLFHRFSCKKN